jgi:anti-sigma B factor antagonist
VAERPVSDQLGISVAVLGSSAVISLAGELDLVGAPGLTDTVVDLIEGGSRTIVVDLEGLAFLDAAGIGALVGANRRVEGVAGTFSVRAPSPLARHILELCSLERLVGEPSLPAPS